MIMFALGFVCGVAAIVAVSVWMGPSSNDIYMEREK